MAVEFAIVEKGTTTVVCASGQLCVFIDAVSAVERLKVIRGRDNYEVVPVEVGFRFME